MILPAPPPIPITADDPVVAGPVLAAGRMLWVTERDMRLTLRSQNREGRARRVRSFPAPVGDRVQVTGFDARGDRVVLHKDVYGSPPSPYQTPGGASVPRLLESFVDHGRLESGRWTTRRRSGASRACTSPKTAQLIEAGIVQEQCLSYSQATITLGRRTLTSEAAGLVGAAGSWVAWTLPTGGARVHNVRRPARSYTIPKVYGAVTVVDDRGRVFADGRLAAPGYCRDAREMILAKTTVYTRQQPTPIDVVTDGELLAASGSITVVRQANSCALSDAVLIGTRRGIRRAADVPIGIGDFVADIDGREVALRTTSTLQRFRLRGVPEG